LHRLPPNRIWMFFPEVPADLCYTWHQELFLCICG
jgi:hypothetical protein